MKAICRIDCLVRSVTTETNDLRLPTDEVDQVVRPQGNQDLLIHVDQSLDREIFDEVLPHVGDATA